MSNRTSRCPFPEDVGHVNAVDGVEQPPPVGSPLAGSRRIPGRATYAEPLRARNGEAAKNASGVVAVELLNRLTLLHLARGNLAKR
jgi:hypothetical protein